MSDITVMVSTHKQYRMPEDPIYLPVFGGAALAEETPGDYRRDDEGENISAKNPYFCELTVLYWGWKNLDCGYLGLVQYRRHFAERTHRQEPFDMILPGTQIRRILEKHRIIVPNKRRYFIETIYSHYKHTHYANQLDQTREIISYIFPGYLRSFDRIMKRRSAYMFNMMIMEKPLVDAYCEWLFTILFQLEKYIDIRGLSAYQGRFYGRVSEILFNVWLDHQIRQGALKRRDIAAVPVLHMEKINWPAKIAAFLNAKFFGKKYEGSF